MPHKPASSALSKIKVLDLTRVRSGPTCVRQLADWGADVIKVEMPEALDPDGALGAPRHTSDFQNLQRNKRSITINMKEAEGVEILKKLVATADVVVENFRPNVKHKLGIDYKSLKAINPRIILGSISGFGQDGPAMGNPGFDQVAQGMAGLMSVTGEPGKGPMRVGIPIADLTAGLFCAHGIMVALFERESSGEGQWVQSSLLQAMTFMLDFQAARWTMDGDVPQQAGNNHPTSIPTGVFQTKDGYMNIAVAGQTIWVRFCKDLDREDWIDNPKYIDGPARSENRHELNAEIEEISKNYTTAELTERLLAAGIPCGPINSIDQAFAEPQMEHLGMRQTVHSETLGDIDLIAQPIFMSRTPSTFEMAPPERSEHTDEVLGELGYSEEERADLRARTVI
ncbi:MAG: CaiB/BaiF CoA transferase family protein [Rhodospirillales bacterium]|jgi:formyl-CoA transferase